VIENDDVEQGSLRLFTELFPAFQHSFSELYAADSYLARQCLEHYTTSVKGPPNRPTEECG
ncbi:unnamed protein product, partial [Chrysoparadoxa australica]